MFDNKKRGRSNRSGGRKEAEPNDVFRFRRGIRRLISYAFERPGEICDLDGMVGPGSMAFHLCAALVSPLDFISDEDGLLGGRDFSLLGIQPAVPSLARMVLKLGRNRWRRRPDRVPGDLPHMREGAILFLKGDRLGIGEACIHCTSPEAGESRSLSISGFGPHWFDASENGRLGHDTLLFDLDAIVALPRFVQVRWEARPDAWARRQR